MILNDTSETTRFREMKCSMLKIKGFFGAAANKTFTESASVVCDCCISIVSPLTGRLVPIQGLQTSPQFNIQKVAKQLQCKGHQQSCMLQRMNMISDYRRTHTHTHRSPRWSNCLLASNGVCIVSPSSLPRPQAPASQSRAHSFFLATQRALLSSPWQWQHRMIGRLWNGPMETQGRVAKWLRSFWTSSFWPQVSFSGEQSDFWPYNATLYQLFNISALHMCFSDSSKQV